MLEENRRNSFSRLPIRGSNPVASSDGGEWLYRAKTAGRIRATEFVPMLLMNEEFANLMGVADPLFSTRSCKIIRS
jgi:hypothetical protein